MSNGRVLLPENDAALSAHPPDVTMTMADASRIARLAMMIHRQHATAPGPRWEDLPAERQSAATMGVMRVVQAMILLGWVEQ